MTEYITTTAVSLAAGGIGWIVTKYLLLPSKVENLQEDIKYLRGKVDDIVLILIQR